MDCNAEQALITAGGVGCVSGDFKTPALPHYTQYKRLLDFVVTW